MGDPRYQHPMGIANQRLDWLVVVVIACSDGSTTIQIIAFFRDFEAFESLKAKVYPVIVNDKANKGTIRMWAPGCSTGEETYSLAMTLFEFLGDKAANFQIQIFGTDLNEKGIEKAVGLAVGLCPVSRKMHDSSKAQRLGGALAI